LWGSGFVQSEKRPLTVAGQWRICTALPEHRASELLVLRQLETQITHSDPLSNPEIRLSILDKLILSHAKGKPE
jgi:hypothetical protein